MSSARVGLVVAWLASAAGGCASTYPPPPAPRDLSAGDLAVGDMAVTAVTDMSAVAGDMSAVAGDMSAVAGDDLAMPLPPPDLAAPDLARCAAPNDDGDDDGGAPPTLYLVAPTANGLFAARARAGAWTALPATAGAVALDEVALALVAGRPLAVARLHDDTLAAAVYDRCAGWPAPVAVTAGASTAARPALVGGTGGDVIFRGSVNGDQRYYWVRFDVQAWSAIATQDNFLSTLAPNIVRVDASVHTIFAGTDGNLYDGVAQPSGGGSATRLDGNTSSLAPAAARAPDGRLHVVYTGMDRHLYWFVAAQPAQVHDLCDGQPAGCFILSDASPVLAIGSDGAPVAVFHGTDGKLYGSRLAGSQWSAASAVSAGEVTAFAPALAPGVDGSLADLVYVRDADKQPRHARLTDGGWQAPATVAPVALQGSPALAGTR
jgi:hypothetical protein